MTDKITYLDEIKEEATSSLTEETEPRRRAVDLSLPLSARMDALVAYYQSEADQVGELIGSITGMYFFSRIHNLKEYMIAIARERRIPISYRIDTALQIDDPIRYEIVLSFFADESESLSVIATPVRINTVLFLATEKQYQPDALHYFTEIIHDTTIQIDYRFRIVQSLERRFSNDRATFLYFARTAATSFLTLPWLTYRILASQYLYEMCEPEEEQKLAMEEALLLIAASPDVNEDTRADACDVLLQYASEEGRVSARTALFVLAGGDRVRNNIFRNAQNVHVRSIEESVAKIVDKLTIYYPRQGVVYTLQDFDKVKTEILAYFPEEEKGDEKVENDDDDDDDDDDEKKVDETKRDEKAENDEAIRRDRESVEGALLRITIDRAVYGHSNMTLASVLVKLWTYIIDSHHSVALHRRLIEELIESNNKCSTGYVSRLVNTLSGFDDEMSVSISYEDQIVANLEGRLNAAIQALSSEEVQGSILEEMMVPSRLFHLRGNFLRFFREHISKIREEMYQEFREYMTDLDYDFYFRKAIIHYEGYDA